MVDKCVNVRFKLLRNIIGALIAIWGFLVVGVMILVVIFDIITGRDIPLFNLSLCTIAHIIMGFLGITSMPKFLDSENAASIINGGGQLYTKKAYDNAAIMCYVFFVFVQVVLWTA